MLCCRPFCFTDAETLRAFLDFLRIPASELKSNKVLSADGRTVTAEAITVGECQGGLDCLLLWAIAHTVLAVKAHCPLRPLLDFVQQHCLKVTESQSAHSRKVGKKLETFLGI